MKWLWAVLLLSGCSDFTSTSFTIPEEHKPKFCALMGDAAAEVMTDRQQGVPISKYLPFKDRADEQTKRVLTDLAVDAYNTPQFDTKKYQDKIIVEFKTKYVVLCYQDRL